MRATKLIAIPLIGIFLLLVACNSGGTTPPPSTTTPPATTPPATTPPATTPPATTPPATTPPATTPPATTPPATTPPATTPPATTPPATTPPAALTGPAKFVITNLRSVPQDGVNNPKWMTALFFTVTNTGGVSGSYTIGLELNGAAFDLKDPALGNKELSVTLGSGEKKDLVINCTEEQGTYTAVVKANGGDATVPVKLTWIER